MQKDDDGQDAEIKGALLSTMVGAPHVPPESISTLPLRSEATHSGAGTVALGAQETAINDGVAGEETVSISCGALQVPLS